MSSSLDTQMHKHRNVTFSSSEMAAIPSLSQENEGFFPENQEDQNDAAVQGAVSSIWDQIRNQLSLESKIKRNWSWIVPKSTALLFQELLAKHPRAHEIRVGPGNLFSIACKKEKRLATKSVSDVEKQFSSSVDSPRSISEEGIRPSIQALHLQSSSNYLSKFLEISELLHKACSNAEREINLSAKGFDRIFLQKALLKHYSAYIDQINPSLISETGEKEELGILLKERKNLDPLVKKIEKLQHLLHIASFDEPHLLDTQNPLFSEESPRSSETIFGRRSLKKLNLTKINKVHFEEKSSSSHASPPILLRSRQITAEEKKVMEERLLADLSPLALGGQDSFDMAPEMFSLKSESERSHVSGPSSAEEIDLSTIPLASPRSSQLNLVENPTYEESLVIADLTHAIQEKLDGKVPKNIYTSQWQMLWREVEEMHPEKYTAKQHDLRKLLSLKRHLETASFPLKLYLNQRYQELKLNKTEQLLESPSSEICRSFYPDDVPLVFFKINNTPILLEKNIGSPQAIHTLIQNLAPLQNWDPNPNGIKLAKYICKNKDLASYTSANQEEKKWWEDLRVQTILWMFKAATIGFAGNSFWVIKDKLSSLPEKYTFKILGNPTVEFLASSFEECSVIRTDSFILYKEGIAKGTFATQIISSLQPKKKKPHYLEKKWLPYTEKKTPHFSFPPGNIECSYEVRIPSFRLDASLSLKEQIEIYSALCCP